MRPRRDGFTAGLALLLAVLPLLGLVAPESLAWQAGGGAYASPQFGYVVQWDERWAERERETVSDEGGFDSMVISNNDGRVQVLGQANDVSADEFLDAVVTLLTGDADASDVKIVSEDDDGEVPSVEVTTGRDRLLLEGQTVEGAVVVVALRARDEDYDEALEAAQGGITLNGVPVLGGEPAAPAAEPLEPTEEPADAPTEEPGAGGIDGTAYTSPNHGFTVTWDDIWEATETTGTGDFDELRLTSPSGSISILAGSFYDGDPETCLAGEDAYFGTEDPNIQGWAPAVDADGEPIAERGDRVAYGVFTFAYGSDDDGYVDLVDYIECRALVPGETTMEILVSTTPDLYEEHIAAALAITNAIEMPEGAAVDPVEPPLPDFEGQATAAEGTPTAEATPIAMATPDAGDETGRDGDTFTSPSFGWSLDVPEGWTVEGETIAAGDETLVLSNGLSTISLHATDAYTGDLPGCIVYARNLLEDDPRYADLRLDTTVSGDAFQGADDVRAFARFTYTGPGGEKWAHFVDCRPLVEGESVLIISQDVPSESYADERLARRQIQRAIEFP